MSTLIHIIWLQGREHMLKTHPEYAKYLASWETLFPAWTIVFWDEAAIQALFQEDQFASMPLAQTYTALKNTGAKSDLARYAIVYARGGMYVDSDLECLKPFQNLLEGNEGLFVAWNDETLAMEMASLANNHWFYAPRPGFKGLWELLESIVQAGRKSVTLLSVMYVTGPYPFQRMLKAHAGDVKFLPAQAMEGNTPRRYGREVGRTAVVYHHSNATWAFKNKAMGKAVMNMYGWYTYNSLPIALVFILVTSILVGVTIVLAVALRKRGKVAGSL